MRAPSTPNVPPPLGAIEIEFQNFVLGKPRLQPDRENASSPCVDGALVIQDRFFASCCVIDDRPV